MKPRHSIHRILAGPAFALVLLALVTGSHAATITKAATGTDLTDGASWGGTAPGSGDIATWVSTSLNASLTLGTSSSWGGIGVAGAAGAIGVTGAGTLTLGSDGINMAFSTVNLTLGTPIELGASQTWNVNSGRTLTGSGIISGTGMGLTKAGAGTLTLSGANTYDGTTTILGGILVADTATNATILNSASPLAFTSSGTFQLKGLAAQSRSQIVNGLTLTSGAATIDANNTGTSTTIDLRGTGSPLTIARSAGTTVDFKATTGTLGTNAIINTAQANDGTGILGAWATVNTGADWAVNNGSNVAAAYTGYNTLGGNTLASGATTNYRVASNPTPPTGNITMAATGTIDANTLRISDAAARTIDVRNGATQGILRFGAIGGLLTSGAGHIIGVAGTATSGTITAGGSTADNPGELVVTNASNLTINSVIANNGTGVVSLTKSGTGTLFIGSSTNNGINTHTGNTTINAGTVVYNGPNNDTVRAGFLGTNNSKVVTVNQGGVLGLQGVAVTGSQLILNGGMLRNDFGGGNPSWTGNVVLNANSFSDNTGNGGVPTTINGNISGVGGLTRTSATGTAHQPLVLNGTNTYTGPTIITSGTVQFPKPEALYNAVETDWAPAKITVNSGGTLMVSVGGAGQFTATQIGTLITQLSTGVNDNGLKSGALVGIDISNAGATPVTISANLADSTGTGGGAVSIKGYGVSGKTLELTGTNTYSGPTSIDNNASLKVSSLNSVATNPSLGTVHSASSNLGAPTTIANGTISLGSNRSYQGATLIYTGTGETTDRVLNMGGGGNDTYRLDQSGAGLLKFTSNMTMTDSRGTKNLVLQGSTAGMGEMAGVIPNATTGSGTALTKSGTGTWTLSAANLFVGVTTVNGGALVLANAEALKGGIGSSGGLSALTLGGGVVGLGAGDFTRPLAAAGTVTGVNFTGAGGWAAYGANRAVNLGGASTTVAWATANTGLNGKTLILGNATATHTVDFQNPLDLGATTRTVQVDNGTAAIDGKLSGSLTNGNLTKTGLGTLALTGSNSYAGATTVSFGTLLVNGTHSGTGLITVASGATLGGTGTIAGAATISTGGKAVFTITRDPLTQANTTPLTIAGVMTFDSTEIHLNVPNNLPSGVYTLATSSNTPTGTVTLTPVLDSGSYAPGVTSAEVSLDTVNNKLLLTVTGLATNPTQLAITSVNGGVSPFAGAGFNVVVQAQDANGASRQVLADTDVSLSLYNGSGTLGGTLTGTISAGNVAVTISGVVYSTAESGVVLTATRTSGDSLTDAYSAPFTVLPSTTPTYLLVTGFPSPQTAGAAGSVTVTAKTASGATATTYTGTVHFTSTAVSAGLPADYTFGSGDNGVHVFSGVTLNTAGIQSITATDTVTSSITGAQSDITVTPATASVLVVAGYPSPRPAGVADSVTVTAKDAYGNTDPAYTGTIQFTSSDGAASLPSNYTFTGGDAGVHVISGVTLNTLGVQSITATDTVTATITGTQSGITVWVPPATFTWRSAVNGNWGDATKWAQSGGLDYAPITAGQSDYVLNFIAGTYTATQNLSNGFFVNQLNFAGAVTLDGTNGLALTNNGATLPTVNQNSSNTVIVNPPVSLASDTTFGGSGSGQVNLYGLISGSGSLTKNGSNTLRIYNVSNSFTGGTIINSGTLLMDIDAKLGAGPITLNGGTLYMWRFHPTNALIVNGGTLLSENGFGNSWDGPITLNTTLICDVYYTLICSNTISGTGGLTKTSGGPMILSNTCTSTYTGPTSVTAGTLQCDNVNALGGSALSISGTGKMNLNYTGTKTVASLTLGGVAQTASGTYGSTASGAANPNDIYFTGTGTVTLPAAGYGAWASANAPGQTPAEDFDNDGVANGIEYFMGATGSSFTAMPGLDATNTVTWPMDPAYSGAYEVQTSPDLVTWTNVDPRPLPSGANLSYTLTTGLGKQFVRLLVTPTP